MGPAIDDPRAPASPSHKRALLITFSILTLAYALLWSPHWYPLSDSALYLTLGRNLADGQGLSAPWNESRLSPPATPILIAAILKLGGGIGAIHALNIFLLLLSHWLCFIALRNWVGRRAALAATIASAAGFWTFQNAFTIMTEPLSMLGFWVVLALLSNQCDQPASAHSGLSTEHSGLSSPFVASSLRRFVASLLLILLAVAARDAAILLLPGLAILLLTRFHHASPRAKLIGTILFILIFGSAFVWRFPEKLGLAKSPDRAPATQTIDPDDEAPNNTPSQNRFKFRFLHDVPRNWRMLTDTPMLAGRWITESLAAPSWALFANKSTAARIASYILGYTVCAVFLVGIFSLIRARQYWSLMVLIYFGVIFFMWGARIKPRYPAFVAPLIILILAQGLSDLLPFVASSLRRSVASPHSARRTQHSGLFLAVLLIIANLPTYALELYIRRRPSRDFHDLARRGAYAPLIDIAAHLRTSTPQSEPVSFNRAPDRRVAHRLIGRPILIIDQKLDNWSNPALASLLNDCATQFAVIYVEHPAPTMRWPRWHWPIARSTPPPFYKLYENTPTGWIEIPVPPDRAYLRAVPPAP